MSELAPSSSGFDFLTNDSSGTKTKTKTIFAGRCRLKTIFLIDISVSTTAGTDAYLELRNGSASGDVFFKMKPTLTAGFLSLWTSQACSFDFPGNGILFPDGMYMKLSLPTETGSTVRGIKATVVYS